MTAAQKAHQDQVGNAFKLAGLSQSASNAAATNQRFYDSLNAQNDRTLATLKAEDIRQIRSINAANGRAADANSIRVQIANASNDLRAQGIAVTRARLKEQITHNAALEARGLTAQQIQIANSLGYYTDPKTGARTPIKGYRLTPTGVKKIPTASAGSRLTQTQRDQMSSASQSAYLAANGGTTQGEKPAFAVYADPGDGTGWSKPLYAPDGVKVIGYINYLPPIDLADALNRARASANPAVAVKAVRRAYKEAQANRKFTSETVAKIGPLFAPTVP